MANTPSKSSLNKVLETSCSGFSISASIKSPSLESSSFPIGVSKEIGQIFDVTRERIRQIEAKALRKLRHPNRNGVLKEYIK